MKRSTAALFSALALLVCIASASLAEEMYVGDITELNVRTGSTTRHKVVATLPPGAKVEVLSFSGGWSKIRTEDGTTGWVSSRFLTKVKPASVRMETLQLQMETEREQAETAMLENNRLKEENITLTTRLNEALIRLEKAETAYETLKTESADYLSLKENCDRIQAEADQKDAKIAELQEKLDDYYLSLAVKWTLTGAGILLAGFFLGSRTRRKRPTLL